MKILIVDDSKFIRMFLTNLAHELHFETVQAYDGQHGMEVLEEQSDFELILVDWDMPRMNGLEFVKAVRNKSKYEEIKIMMVTTQNTMERVTSAIEAGATDFLMKPVSRESLEDKLRVLGVLV